MWPKHGKSLKGIVPPMITPLKRKGNGIETQIDEESTSKIVEYFIEAGVVGVFILGTSGEFASLKPSMRIEFIQICCRIVDGRIPVLVGITDCSLDVTIELAQEAKAAGAAACVLSTPFYFPLTQFELKRYVEHVTEQIELPVLLYNIPSLTKVWFEIDTVKELCLKYPTQIIGMKDSSGDLTGNLDYFEKLCCEIKRERPEFSIFVGPDNLLADAIKMGGDGGVNSGSNVEPNLFVKIAKVTTTDEEASETQIENLMARVKELTTIYQVGAPGFCYLIAIKTALSIRGLLNEDVMLPPLSSFDVNQRQKVKHILDGLPSTEVR